MKGNEVHKSFELINKTAIVTGAAGLLGVKHMEALMEYGASCVLADVCLNKAQKIANDLNKQYKGKAIAVYCDITNKKSVENLLSFSLSHFKGIDILINNAANNPKQESMSTEEDKCKRFETFPIDKWQDDMDVGLKGAFLCSQVVGTYFATQKRGVILNVSSDLGLIAPDQRIYRKAGIDENLQPTKPVTYSVVKSGMIGLTKYVATYWADRNVRCNAIVPGGIYVGQETEFVEKLTNLIPMGRMANVDDYKAAIVFLCSEASTYMTGASVVMDGGRTCW